MTVTFRSWGVGYFTMMSTSFVRVCGWITSRIEFSTEGTRETPEFQKQKHASLVSLASSWHSNFNSAATRSSSSVVMGGSAGGGLFFVSDGGGGGGEGGGVAVHVGDGDGGGCHGPAVCEVHADEEFPGLTAGGVGEADLQDDAAAADEGLVEG
jgi:hypothetical protein